LYNVLYSVNTQLYISTVVLYRVSIKSFPDYKHLLQENYCTWNTFFFQNVTQEVFLQHISTLQHILLLLYGERLIDNYFSPRVLQHVFNCCSKSLLFLLQICNIWNWCRKQFFLNIPHKKKSRGLISGERGGQGVGPSLPIHLFENVAPKNQMLQKLQ